MGARVFTIERHNDLYNAALGTFDSLNLKIAARCSDGTIGWSEFAPYNGIIVTAGGPTVPVNLKKQLAVGGKLIIPSGIKHRRHFTLSKKLQMRSSLPRKFLISHLYPDRKRGMERKVIVIAGPTCSGKTKASLDLAAALILK